MAKFTNLTVISNFVFRFAMVGAFFWFLTGCSKEAKFTEIKNNVVNADDTTIIDIDKKVEKKCVQVFYDRSQEANYKIGRIYALMLLNLLGHFPEFQQIVGPIELYRDGDLDRCEASFYIGSYYNNNLPEIFLQNYKTTSKKVVWLGYNFWKLGDYFTQSFGYSNYEFTTFPDFENKAADGKPSFYRDILYKGETFVKYNELRNNSPPSFIAPVEMTYLKNKISDASEVLAEAQHSFTQKKIPWAIGNTQKFYVAEIPFSYIHEADRYLVFADLLFDFLGVPAKHNEKYALLRLEDIHPYVSLSRLDEAVQILKKNKITPHISIIPILRDPLFNILRDNPSEEIRMEEMSDFFAVIKQLVLEKCIFIWHGVTHQYNSLKNPFTGASGDDYEFWDITRNTPVAEDGVSFVLDKLDNGFNSLIQAGIAPTLWLSPHYHASALDNIIFGQIFKAVIGRGVYSDFKASGLPKPNVESFLGFDFNETASKKQNRRGHFSALEVQVNENIGQFGQIYPYEIYGNIYNQLIIPENLGNIQPYLNDQVVSTRTVETILADAKRNLVLRDAWASVFYHPFLLDPENNVENADTNRPKDLERLIVGIKALGYTFINIENYVKDNQVLKAEARIELKDLRE